MRGGDVGGDLAARFGGDGAERLDHGGNGEEAAVLRDDAQEVADEAGDPRLVGDGRDGLELFLGREDRAPDHAGEVVAFGKQRLEAAEIGLDLIDCVGLDGKLIKRARIAFGNTGDWRTGLCH